MNLRVLIAENNSKITKRGTSHMTNLLSRDRIDN